MIIKFVDEAGKSLADKEYVVKDFNQCILSCIGDVIGNDHYISFLSYYDNADLMNAKGCFPYIELNGRYIWNVPYECVSVKDFALTHNLNENDTIVVNVDSIGGKGAFLGIGIATWMQLKDLFIATFVSVNAFKSFCEFMEKACNYFCGINGDIVVARDLLVMLAKHKEWTLDELSSLTDIQDTFFLNELLHLAGFEEKRGVYKLNIKKHKRALDSISDSDDCWRVEIEQPELLDLSFSLLLINRFLSCLTFSPLSRKGKYYEFAKIPVDKMIQEYDHIFARGEQFRYLTIKRKVRINSAKELATIKNLVSFVGECLELSYYHLEDLVIPDVICKVLE